MWHCSQCGEAIPDNFDVCWHCGTHRDGTAANDFQAEPDDPSVPDPRPDSSESDQAIGGERTTNGRPERALTQRDLGEVLLRVLGVLLAARGIIAGVGTTADLLVLWRKFGLDFGLGHFQWEFLVGPTAELMIGIYLLVGGQWVYEKVLTPIVRSSPEDAPQETKEDSSDDGKRKDNT
jgi:hypothetical protein